MNSTRIAFLDVDGTITEHGSIIAPSTAAAIRRARRNGHQVWICTGRADGDIHPDVRSIGFDGVISNGGAYAIRGDELLVERPMTRDDVEAIEIYLEERDVPYFLQTHEAVFASDGLLSAREEAFARLRNEQHPGLPEPDPAPAAPRPRHRPLEEVDRDRVAKAVFISTATGEVERAATGLGGRFHVIPGSMPFPGGSNGEIGIDGVTKGSAILEVLDLLGMSVDDAIGIGDSWNDVPMFEVVGTPVAMGNAAPELQARAGRVTTAVLDDGIHNAFVELGLI